ncbi:hypothetical protein GT030_08250 [Streptomyces sp. SID1328]|uniref:hypothetical protein n=1 Tax=Streptomyces sp. SID1328 TaxID=2690250 RepID=UPI001371E9AE|nr:hypothetical protein [Streptomyces sp. SID1328]MYV38862.1 hypothetical protein [Streptomyces sp. SID1328]
MRETPDAGRKRFDLNVPQVAGSALAAVVAAKMASYFGVYGTILGAGVVSIVATCGGSVFQQFFRRTGEQLREVRDPSRSRTPAVAAQPGSQPVPGEFTEGTVYRAKVKSWKRPLLATALVFGVTMGGITVYEAASGSSFSGGSGTTVSDAVGGHDSSHHRRGDDPAPATTPSGTTGPTGETPAGGGSSTTGPTTPETPRTPGDAPSGAPGEGATTPVPTPSEGATDPAPTTPEPSASSRSGTSVPGPAGSATP